MKKKILILFLFLFTGCSNYTDINNIAVISSIGIAYENEIYKIYVNVLSSNKENQQNIYVETCSNLNECFDKLNNKLMKRLYLTHLDLLILEEDLDIVNLNHIFDFFLSHKSSRNTFSLVSINKIDEKLFYYNTEDINNMLDLSKNSTGIVKSVTLDSVIKDILNYKLSYIPFFKYDSTIEILGYKTIYLENKILSKEDSLSLSLIKNYLKNFSVLINQKSFRLEECNTLNSVKKNFFDIRISCKYTGSNFDDSIKVKNYLTTIINNFIKNNNDAFFKYIYSKYQNNIVDDINYTINITIDYMEKTGGGLFE